MGAATYLGGSVSTQYRGLPWMALSEQGTILNLAGTADSGGGSTRSWNASGTVVCRIDPLTGSEGEAANRTTDRATHLITIPAATAIGTEDRFASGGITFEVTEVRQRTNEWVREIEAVTLS